MTFTMVRMTMIMSKNFKAIMIKKMMKRTKVMMDDSGEGGNRDFPLAT